MIDLSIVILAAVFGGLWYGARAHRIAHQVWR